MWFNFPMYVWFFLLPGNEWQMIHALVIPPSPFPFHPIKRCPTCMDPLCFKPPSSFMNHKNKNSPVLDLKNMTLLEKFPLHWYVIEESRKIRPDKLYKATVWNKDYVYWKSNGTFYAFNDDCSHRGASLSKGYLNNNHVTCPYHGYEFDSQGVLCKVPGLNFQNSACQNQETFPILEKNGWVYLNTVSYSQLINETATAEATAEATSNTEDPTLYCKNNQTAVHMNVYEEPESFNDTFSCIFINKIFRAYGRIVSENSLDVMHIGFVHTFGNKNKPDPISERPPYLVNDYPFHYKTEYTYESGKDSIAKKVFSRKTLKIENEFILPHMTVARILFGDFVSTVITFSTPINMTHTRLFVKTYRNFWNHNDVGYFTELYSYFGDQLTTAMMEKTVEQDRSVVENIKFIKMDGKFNMKFDKLQNVYRSFYRRLVHNSSRYFSSEEGEEDNDQV